jgi:hypothetical protein
MGLLIALAFFSLKSCEGAEITITKHAPFEYPAEVAGMSDEVFFDWATEYNEQQVREIKRSSEPKWLYSYGVQTRITHGVSPMRGVSDMQIVRERYPRRYLNPDYFPPSALMVINPYCKPKR